MGTFDSCNQISCIYVFTKGSISQTFTEFLLCKTQNLLRHWAKMTRIIFSNIGAGKCMVHGSDLTCHLSFSLKKKKIYILYTKTFTLLQCKVQFLIYLKSCATITIISNFIIFCSPEKEAFYLQAVITCSLLPPPLAANH